MDPQWRDSWWIIIPLAAFTIPLAGILLGAFNNWLWFRQRREALEIIRTYAAQGKDPPPDLLAALSPRRYGPGAYAPGSTGLGGAADASGGPPPDPAAAFVGAKFEARAARRAARAERHAWRIERRLAMAPVRRWNQAIFTGALAIGFYVAAQYTHSPDTAGRFQIGAIILGALSAASLLSAIVTMVIRAR